MLSLKIDATSNKDTINNSYHRQWLQLNLADGSFRVRLVIE